MFTDAQLPTPPTLTAALAAFIREPKYSANQVRWSAVEPYSSRNSAKMLAGAVECALDFFARGKLQVIQSAHIAH
jgi:hypothetical protein